MNNNGVFSYYILKKKLEKTSITWLILFIIIATLVQSPSYGQDWKTYPYYPDNSVIQFPDDEGRHPKESIEWWYINGHVKGQTTGHEYAFMVCYFYFSFLGYDGFRILDLFNLTTGDHEVETYPCNYTILANDSLHIVTNMGVRPEEHWLNLTNAEGQMIPFEYSLLSASDNEKLDLLCISLKPPLIVGDSGYFNQGADSYTYYYSQTELELSGQLRMNGLEETVEGTGWIDRQYGSFNPYQKEEYEWFSLQLSNGTEVNLWNIFTPDNRIPVSSEYRICNILFENNEIWKDIDFQLSRLNYACTGNPEICYGSRWNLVIEELNLDLIIETLDDDHVVLLPFRFFEGPVTINGTVDGQYVTGKGFAELLHTYDNPDVTIEYPEHGRIWDGQEFIRWSLNNPDEGNPLVYDLQLLNRNGRELVAIKNLGSTQNFAFDPALFVNDTIAGLQLKAYSADSTISGETTVYPLVVPDNHVYYLTIGETIYLNVQGPDHGEYDYQWIKDGSVLTGKNSGTLKIENLAEENSGIYNCIISGIHFSDTTVSYYLFVGTGEMVYQQAFICEGDSFFTGSRWVSKEGLYVDSLTNISGFDSLVVSELNVGICTAVDDYFINSDIIIFPDITGNNLYIQVPDPFSGQVYVVDMQGRLIMRKEIHNVNLIQLDQSRIKPGMYILILNGKQSYITKFIRMQQ